MHLEEMKKRTGVVGVAEVLQREMKRRFQHFIDPSKDTFDPLYLVAAALDPRFTIILSNEQIEIVKAELNTELKREAVHLEACDTDNTEIGEREEEHEPPLKRFRYLSGIVSSKCQERQTSTSHVQQPTENEVKCYFQNLPQLPHQSENHDPLDFWIQSVPSDGRYHKKSVRSDTEYVFFEYRWYRVQYRVC